MWPSPPTGLIEGATRSGTTSKLRLEFPDDAPRSSLVPPITIHGTYRAAKGTQELHAVCMGPPEAETADHPEIVWGPHGDGDVQSLLARCGSCEVMVTTHHLDSKDVVELVQGVRLV